MHCRAEVWIEKLDDVEASVWDAMKPFQEILDWEPKEDSRGVDYDYSVCFWDWFEIGGRFDKSHGESNILPVEEVTDELEAVTLVAKGQSFGSWNDDEYVNVKEKLKELGITTGYLVTVDYHC